MTNEYKTPARIRDAAFKPQNYIYKGYIINRPKRFRYEIWKDGKLVQWFTTYHETIKHIEWRNFKSIK